jgi:hypothetical protein
MVEFDANKRRWHSGAMNALDQGTAFSVIARGRRADRIRYYFENILRDPKRRSGFRAALVAWHEAAFNMVYFYATQRGWTVGYTSPAADTLLVTFRPVSPSAQLH